VQHARVKGGGVARHLEGWQAGLVALAIAGVGLLLGAPRGVEPVEVPLPIAEAKALQATAATDARQAAEMRSMSDSERSGAGYDLRVVGERLRAYNAADDARDADALARARHELLLAIRIVRERDGAEPLLRLRAYHLSIFQRELLAWESTGVQGDELRAVGGDFIGLAQHASWTRPPHQLSPDATVRAALFKRRFAEVTSLREAAFALSLDESRALYAFMLSHPLPGEGTPAAREQAAWTWTLRKAEEFALIDPSYPIELARGVALIRLGNGREAVIALRDHLGKHPDGPYTLRARNYLAKALELGGQP
jgi:hypothetical protein